jgi:hypothetical protein
MTVKPCGTRMRRPRSRGEPQATAQPVCETEGRKETEKERKTELQTDIFRWVFMGSEPHGMTSRPQGRAATWRSQRPHRCWVRRPGASLCAPCPSIGQAPSKRMCGVRPHSSQLRASLTPSLPGCPCICRQFARSQSVPESADIADPASNDRLANPHSSDSIHVCPHCTACSMR